MGIDINRISFYEGEDKRVRLNNYEKHPRKIYFRSLTNSSIERLAPSRIEPKVPVSMLLWSGTITWAKGLSFLNTI
jgi:hypothetical protein